MFIKQLSIFVENKHGRLEAIISSFADNGHLFATGFERRQKPRADQAKGGTIGDCLGLANDV